MRTNNLVVIGNISRDTVYYQDVFRDAFWGGGGLNISWAAAQAGCIPLLISIAGQDASTLIQEISPFIDTTLIHIADGPICQFRIDYTGTGKLQKITCDFGAAELLDSYIENLTLPPAFYHVSCRKPLDPAPILARLVQKNLSFSLDGIISSFKAQMEKIGDWLPRASYVFVNQYEYEVLSELITLQKIQNCMVTSDTDAVRWLQFGREILRIPIQKKNFYEVTGAGDVFSGTFLASRLLGCAPLESLQTAMNQAGASLDRAGVLTIS